ncbi:MAG TPA: ThuA domain-containing protein, partial [Vicinamibacteria bacterium]|nr:ThuA domain-containing protein [Vicinamibacteria bacterium]
LPPDWGRYAAVVGYIHGTLQEATESRIIEYVRAGGRYVCLHHSISSGKAKNAHYFDFLGVRLPGTEKAREPAAPGDHYAWREGIDLQVVNLNPGHFITTRGITWPESATYRPSDEPSAERAFPAFTLRHAEAYMNVQFTDGREKTVLLGFKYRDDRNGVLFMQDREGWLKPSGKGWVVYLQMGHSTHEFEHPVVAQLVLNAIDWQPDGSR